MVDEQVIPFKMESFTAIPQILASPMYFSGFCPEPEVGILYYIFINALYIFLFLFSIKIYMDDLFIKI